MEKVNQNKFYKSLGSLITRQRIAKCLSISQLAREAGEQYKTIRNLEAGRPCSMHHIGWMQDVLGIQFDDMEEESVENEITIGDLNDLI